MPAADRPRVQSPKRTPRRKTAVLVDALAEAAWTEADHALAEAMAEVQVLKAAADDEARDDALALLEQALGRAARKRGLSRFGEVGAREAYDPNRHDLARPLTRPPKLVRIIAGGVMRGNEMVIKARAIAVRSRT